MKIRYISFSLLVLISVSMWFMGCKKDDPTGPGTDVTTVKTTISGVVLDAFNQPIPGAQVTASGNNTAVSASDGTFLLQDITVPKDRFVVNVTKGNYFDGSIADVPKANGSVSIKVYLLQGDISENINAGSGGTIETSNGTGVQLPANAVVKNGADFSGNVKMTIAYLDPTSENFSSVVPGGDLQAQTTNNTPTTLYSYGIIKVDMKDDAGSKLELKSGTTSTITVDIPPSMEGNAPATIPLWHYDSVTGLWKEEGTATKQGDKYVGTVGHFSDWNCDVPGGTGTIKGLVVDCNNLPVQGISVKIGQAAATTGADGRFERRAPINIAFEVQVLGSSNYGLSSTPKNVSGLTEGQVLDLGTFAIDCPAYVKGSIKCGTQVLYGQVVISWAGGYNSQFTDGEGKFKIPVDINKSAKLSVHTYDNKYLVVPITTPAARGELDMGALEVCNQVVLGDNKYTLNGDGFTNKTVVCSDSMVVGFLSADSSNTSIIEMINVTGNDTLLFMIAFSGTSVGAATDVILWLYTNSSYYLGMSGVPGISAAVNVTKYEGVGGLIEGTFSGTLFKNGSPTGGTINVTNGKFSVVRILIGASRPSNKYVPKAYWDKMP